MKIKYMYVHIDQNTLLKRWQKSIYHRFGVFILVRENKRDTVSNLIFWELFKIVFNCFHVRSITNIFTNRYVFLSQVQRILCTIFRLLEWAPFIYWVNKNLFARQVDKNIDLNTTNSCISTDLHTFLILIDCNNGEFRQ